MTKTVMMSITLCTTLGALVTLCSLPIGAAGPCDAYPKKVSPCSNYKRRCLQVEPDATKCKDKARVCHDADWTCRARDEGNMWSMCCSGKDVVTSKEFLSDYHGACAPSVLSNETARVLSCTKGDNNFDDEGTPMPVRMKVEHHDSANEAVNTDMLGGLKEAFDTLCYKTGCSRQAVTPKYKQDTTVWNMIGTAGVDQRKMKCTFEYSGSFKNDGFKTGAFELLKSEFSRATTHSISNVIGYGYGQLEAYKAPTYVRVSIDEDDDDQYLQLDLHCEAATTPGICGKVGSGIRSIAAEVSGWKYGWSSVNMICSLL